MGRRNLRRVHADAGLEIRAYQVRADPQAQTRSQNLRVSGLSGHRLWPVPWFHENALLQGEGRDDDLADDGAGCAVGENEGSSGTLTTLASSLS